MTTSPAKKLKAFSLTSSRQLGQQMASCGWTLGQVEAFCADLGPIGRQRILDAFRAQQARG